MLPTDFISDEKTSLETLYLSYLFNISLNMFEYSDMPKSVDTFYLEFIQQTRGLCIIIDDERFGPTALECTIGGKLNHYYMPTAYRGVDPTGELTGVYNAEDVILFKNSPLYAPLLPQLQYYSKQLALASETINVNLDAQWTPYIIQGDKRMLNQFNNFMKKVRSGVRAIFTAKNLDLMSMLQVLPTQAPFVAMDVNDVKQTILRECMTFLGIDNANQDKRERVQSAEVYANNTQIIASRNIWLAERQKAVDAFNQKFGTNVKVSFRAYNDMLDMMEVNDMSLEEMASLEEGDENV
jgi:hypothetical protein